MESDNKEEKSGRGSPVYSVLESGADGKTLRVVTPDGLALITMLAKNGKPHSFIASKLGMTRHAFRKALGSAESENPVRMAYERGYGEHEAEVQKQLWTKAKKSNHPAPIIFYAKAHLGWRETDTPLIDARTDNRIQITVPDSMGYGEMLKALGQDRELDFRKDKRIPLNEALAASPLLIEEPATPINPRVCSTQELAYLKANGLYNSKIHLTEGEEPNGESSSD